MEGAGSFAPAPAAPSHSSTAGADDTVDLSDAARLRQRLRAEVGDAGTTDATRVARLREQVAAGTYAPRAEDVATSLLGNVAAELLS